MATKPAAKKAAAMKPVENVEAEKPVTKSTHQPNVIWRGKGEPPTPVRFGMLDITPSESATQQREGFYSERADLLTYIKGYKTFKPKG